MNESYGSLEQRRKAVSKKIAKAGPFIMGTPAYVKVRCGYAGCDCVRDPKKRHEKLHLSWTEGGGKNGVMYIPMGLRQEVLEWVENYWIVKEWMKEMTELSRKIIRLYVKTRKRKVKRQ